MVSPYRFFCTFSDQKWHKVKNSSLTAITDKNRIQQCQDFILRDWLSIQFLHRWQKTVLILLRFLQWELHRVLSTLTPPAIHQPHNAPEKPLSRTGTDVGRPENYYFHSTRWNWGTKRLQDLHEVTQSVGIKTPVPWSPGLCSNSCWTA